MQADPCTDKCKNDTYSNKTCKYVTQLLPTKKVGINQQNWQQSDANTPCTEKCKNHSQSDKTCKNATQ
jgi:hypothetical protein